MNAVALKRKRSTWISYGQASAFGWFIYGLGPAMVLLSDEQGTTPVVMSLHTSAMALGTIISGALTPAFVVRWGRGRLLRVAGLGIALGISLLVFAPNTYVSLSATFLTGIFSAAAVTTTSSFLSHEHGPASPIALSEANAGAALTGLLSPLIIGALVGAGFGWRIGLFVAVVALVLLEVFRGPLSNYSQVEAHHTNTHGALSRAYWWGWLLIGCTTGAEFILISWSTELLRSWGGLADAAAVASAATFTSGLLFGRLILSQLARRLPSETLLRWMLVTAIIASLLFWLANLAPLMLVALFLCGLTMAGHWPLGITRLVRLGGNQPDRASALSAYATGIAGMLMPVVLGMIAQQVDTHTAFLMLPLVFVAALLIVLFKPEHPAPAA